MRLDDLVVNSSFIDKMMLGATRHSHRSIGPELIPVIEVTSFNQSIEME